MKRLLALALVLGVVGPGACVECGEGTCECADGEEIRVRSAPCECGSVCAPHGGVCRDDYAGCPADAGDGGEDAGDQDAWPWPWDAGGS